MVSPDGMGNIGRCIFTLRAHVAGAHTFSVQHCIRIVGSNNSLSAAGMWDSAE